MVALLYCIALVGITGFPTCLQCKIDLINMNLVVFMALPHEGVCIHVVCHALVPYGRGFSA